MVIARVASDAGSGDISSPGQVPWTSSSFAPQRRNQGRAASRPVAMRAAPEATVPPIVPIFDFMGYLPKPEKKPGFPVRTLAGDGEKVAGSWAGGGGAERWARQPCWTQTVETFPARFSTT